MAKSIDLREGGRLGRELLRAAGGRFGGLFDAASFGMALVDTRGNFLHANSSFEELVGRTEEELTRTALPGITALTHREALERFLFEAREGERRTLSSECRYLHADGHELWVFHTAGLITDHLDRPLCFLIQAHDIEERKREEEGRGRVVAIASHELRAPLTSVIGYAALLSRHWDQIEEQEKLQYVTLIEEQGKRLARMVGDLLTLSRADGGTLKVESEPLDVLDLARRAVGHLGEGCAVEMPTGDGPVAMADAQHVEQIALNLLTNAFKYGAPPVAVETYDTGEWVEIHVTDRGGGVPDEFVPRLFETFARADEAATSGISGTGLGLSIVRGLARAQGGDVRYERNDPGGSRFIVRLPKAR